MPNLPPLPNDGALPIDALAIGAVGVIVAIDPDNHAPDRARRLCELGFDEGVDVEVLHRAPFGGDPLAVRVGNMVVALRREMARLVTVAQPEAAARP